MAKRMTIVAEKPKAVVQEEPSGTFPKAQRGYFICNADPKALDKVPEYAAGKAAIGMPRGTRKFTVAQLREKGLVGVYTVNDNGENIEHLR